MSKARNNAQWFTIVGILLIMVAVIAIVCFLLQGETTVIGNYPERQKSKTLSCENNGLRYPIFTTNNSTVNNTKINIFFDDNKVSTISLVNTATYNTTDEANKATDAHHGDMNIDFGPLGADALNARYTTNNNDSQMSLYAAGKELNSATYKYFLIDGAPTDFDDYKKNYVSQNFICKENN